MSGLASSRSPALIPRFSLHLPGRPALMHWRGDGAALAVASDDGQVQVMEGATGAVGSPWTSHPGGVLAMAWQPGANVLATGGQEGVVRLWDATTGSLRHEFQAGTAWVEKVVWHASGRWCAAACGKVIYWWDVEAGRGWKTMNHPATVADLAWSPDGRVLAAASYGGVWLWEPGAQEAVQHLAWKGSSLSLAWSPDGRFLAAGEQDSSVHFWFVREKKECRMWGFPGKVRHLAWDHAGRYLATGSGSDICLWDCADPGPEGREPTLCQITDAKLGALAWNHKHNLLAAGHADGVVRLWQPPTSPFPRAEIPGDASVTHVEWSPEGGRLALARVNGWVELY